MQKSPDGLYVCLNSFLGFGKKYIMNYVNKTNRHLFLHLKQVKRPKKESMETQESGIPEKVSKMAIGVEGGFSSDIKKDEYDDFNEIVVIKGPDSWKSFPIGNKDATRL